MCVEGERGVRMIGFALQCNARHAPRWEDLESVQGTESGHSLSRLQHTCGYSGRLWGLENTVRFIGLPFFRHEVFVYAGALPAGGECEGQTMECRQGKTHLFRKVPPGEELSAIKIFWGGRSW